MRLLVDDLDARSRNHGFAALHAHPAIEVRLFNPHAYRAGTIPMALGWANRFNRLTRRMHNKSWIVDNRIAVVGGLGVFRRLLELAAGLPDDPLKASPAYEGGDESAVLAAMLPWMEATEQRLTLASPYFVPGRDGAALLIGLAGEGREVRVLTNSLAANDVAAVHGGYARHRKKLIKGGVQLWELKPEPGGPQTSFAGSSVASLHTKALVVDGTAVFVGSYNLDPRSTALNCEQVVFVSDPALAAEVEALFAIETGPERAWRVTHGAGGLRWDDDIETHDSDPGATAGRRGRNSGLCLARKWRGSSLQRGG